MKLAHTLSLLVIWPCVLIVGIARVTGSISLVFMRQIKGVWQ